MAKRGWRTAVFAGAKLPLNSGVSGETNKRCTMLYGIRHLVPSISLWLMIMPANAQTTATRPRVDFATYLSGSSDTAILGLAVDSKVICMSQGNYIGQRFPYHGGRVSSYAKAGVQQWLLQLFYYIRCETE